jgi:hypothetical protein
MADRFLDEVLQMEVLAGGSTENPGFVLQLSGRTRLFSPLSGGLFIITHSIPTLDGKRNPGCKADRILNENNDTILLIAKPKSYYRATSVEQE